MSEILQSRPTLQRPQRADARRNYDALLVVAREVFAREGSGASLEEIARGAGVGIGTLYRNFPCRQDLFEALYVEEVDQLCATAQGVGDLPAWDGLVVWLRRFIDYVATKRTIAEELDWDSDTFCACRGALHAAGAPLLAAAQAAGAAREVAFDDMLKLVIGVSAVAYGDAEQRERVFGLALDAIRAPAA